MGRATYTPNTVGYLLVQAALNPDAGVSVGCSRVGSPRLNGSDNGDSEHKWDAPEVATRLQPVVNLPHPSASTSAAAQRAHKDAPVCWSQRSFDPDGDDLLEVTERFLAPGEAIHNPNELHLSDSDYGSEHSGDEQLVDESMDEDEADGADEADEDEEEDDENDREDSPIEIYEVPEEDRLSVEDLARLLRRPDQSDADGEPLLTSGRLRRRDAQRLFTGLFQNARPVAELSTRGNDRAQMLAFGPPADAAAEAEDDAVFSPSSAVFHSHTLPFTLPSSDAMQMQRRASSGSPSRLR